MSIDRQKYIHNLKRKGERKRERESEGENERERIRKKEIIRKR